MFISISPIDGPMPRRTPKGIAVTILSRMFITESRMNTMPSTRMMHRAAWKALV